MGAAGVKSRDVKVVRVAGQRLAVLVDVSVALGVERADAVVDGDAPLETDRVGVAVRDGVVAGVGV